MIIDLYPWQPNTTARTEQDIFPHYTEYQKHNQAIPSTAHSYMFDNDDVFGGHLNQGNVHHERTKHILKLNSLGLRLVTGSSGRLKSRRSGPLDLGARLRMGGRRLGRMRLAHRMTIFIKYVCTWCQLWTCFMNQFIWSKWWVA